MKRRWPLVLVLTLVALWAQQPAFPRVAIDGVGLGDAFVDDGRGQREWVGPGTNRYLRLHFPGTGQTVCLEGCARHVQRVEGGRVLQVGSLTFSLGAPAQAVDSELARSGGTARDRYYTLPGPGLLTVHAQAGRIVSFELSTADWVKGYHRCPGFDEEEWLRRTGALREQERLHFK